MDALIKRFVRVALVLLILFGLFAYFLSAETDSDTVKENQDYTSAAAETLAKKLQNLPPDDWINHFYHSNEYIELAFEYDPIATFSAERIKRFRSGETEVGLTPEDTVYASRFVPGTDHVFTLYYDDEFYVPPIIPQSILYLILFLSLILFLTYYVLVARPLSLQLRALEDAARGVASGNFALRVPIDGGGQYDRVATRFNEMTAQIEGLVLEKNSVLDDYREMLRAVAHEFRGPLTRIRFALDMAEDPRGEQASRTLFRKIGSDLDELNLLISEVLSYARLQPGAPSFTFTRVNLDELIKNTVAEGRVNYPSIDFETPTDDHANTTVVVDSFYMQRALLNLLNNAARHANSMVRITGVLANERCTVYVDDDGDGVPAHWQERIFEPFVRVDPSRSRHSGGVGLGLAIAKRVIENHSGHIAVSDAPGLGGARFTLSWSMVHTPNQDPPIESSKKLIQ